MRLSLRVILEPGPESYTEQERQELVSCLCAAPGVEAVEPIYKHSRGGYIVIAEVASPSAETVLQYLAMNGYRAVI